ncbi:hypothetical protein, partial [Acinetobacter baumannii]
MNTVTATNPQDSQNSVSQSADNATSNIEENKTSNKQDEAEKIEHSYLSPKAQKLLNKKQSLVKEIELLEQALEEEIKEARKKTVDSVVSILEKNGLLDVSPKVWK